MENPMRFDLSLGINIRMVLVDGMGTRSSLALKKFLLKRKKEGLRSDI